MSVKQTTSCFLARNTPADPVEADSSALPEGLLDRPLTAEGVGRVFVPARFSVLSFPGFSRQPAIG